MADLCANCAAPLAPDQRYCLECGERRASLSDAPSAFAGGDPSAAGVPGIAPVSVMPHVPGSGTPAVIAGVGVLLLAMGVGVLIGRSGSAGTASAGPASVVSVAAPGAAATSTAPTSAASLTDDWPVGKTGYTVRLQTLPQTATETAAVDSAKAAAAAKGAKDVGVLKSDDFSSLAPGSYVIYSGVYSKKPDAQRALAALKKSFPAAALIKVSNASGSSSSATESSSGSGQTPEQPAPPTVVPNLRSGSGQSNEQKSKNLPDVISTG